MSKMYEKVISVTFSITIFFNFREKYGQQFQQPFLYASPEALAQEDGGETFQDGCNDSRGKVYKSREKELSKTEVFYIKFTKCQNGQY